MAVRLSIEVIREEEPLGVYEKLNEYSTYTEFTADPSMFPVSY
jgi:hypothetical protein